MIKPLVTEKTLKEAAQNKYTFVVDAQAEKPQIAKAIAGLYGVTVTRVQTTAIPGRSHRVGVSFKRTTSQKGKKAVISLAKGQKIDIYETPDDKK